MEIADGPTNMALDRELLKVGKGWRVYGWDGPWVSLGRFQEPDRALMPGWEAFCVRPTGGRAVLHGHDITFSFALAHGRLVDSRSVKAVYRQLIAPLVAALNECGLDCRLAETTRYVGKGRASEDCFAFRSPNDIVDASTGRKVCGCALRITDSAALLQASIPIAEPPFDPALAIFGAAPIPTMPWNASAFPAAIARLMASEYGR